MFSAGELDNELHKDDEFYKNLGLIDKIVDAGRLAGDVVVKSGKVVLKGVYDYWDAAVAFAAGASIFHDFKIFTYGTLAVLLGNGLIVLVDDLRGKRKSEDKYTHRLSRDIGLWNAGLFFLLALESPDNLAKLGYGALGTFLSSSGLYFFRDI